MFNYIYEYIIGIKLCKVPLNEQSYVSYKENPSLKEVIELIGRRYGKSSEGKYKKTDYYLGLRYIKKQMENKASLSQIRRLVKPHCRSKRAMMFPCNTMEILKTIINIIDNGNSCIFKECRELKHSHCCSINNMNLVCRDFLVGNFYKCLAGEKENLNTKRYAYTLLEELALYKHNCKI